MSSPAKKIKILHVVDLSKTGGVEVMFMHFLSYVTTLNANISHEVFALRCDPNRLKKLQALDIKVYAPDNNGYNFLRRLNLIRLVALEKYDIVHGQNFSGNFWAAFASFFQSRGVKLICHEHGGSWGAEGLVRAMSFFWAFASDLVICNSNAASKVIRSKVYSKANLQVIYNGVHVPPVSNEIPFEKSVFDILFVGRLEEVKGVKELVLALKILSDNRVEFTCHVLGDGVLRSWLSSFIEQNDLARKVKLHGVVSNVNQYMAAADVLVLPSIREPLGNVIIEASNFCLPTVATRVDGIVEIVKQNETGILLTPRYLRQSPKLPRCVVNECGVLVEPMALDPRDLADALLRLKENPAEREALGLRARQLLQDYTIERYADAILEVYLGTQRIT